MHLTPIWEAINVGKISIDFHWVSFLHEKKPWLTCWTFLLFIIMLSFQKVFAR